jgi:hypothetical protein
MYTYVGQEERGERKREEERGERRKGGMTHCDLSLRLCEGGYTFDGNGGGERRSEEERGGEDVRRGDEKQEKERVGVLFSIKSKNFSYLR